jgi:tetratricopeptide (TPR) repeat protein
MIYRRQTWQHIFEERSESQLKDAFGSVGWVVERLKHDYGEDLFGRQFEQGNPTGHEFFIQLKGTDNVEQYRLKRGGTFSYPIELVNLAQWYSYTLPVILILWDITTRIGYWVHVQPFIQHNLDKNSSWLDNKSSATEPTRNVQIPTAQVIKEHDIELLKPTIEREWKKIKLGKNHFEILYKATDVQLGEEYVGELPPAIERQLRITESKAYVIANPQEPKGWLDLAALHYEINDFNEALKAINQAWRFDNKDSLIRQVRACILAEYAIKNNNPSSLLHEAISLFNSVQEKVTELAKYNLGNCYSALGQHETAIKYYNEALKGELEPDQLAQILINRGNSLVKIGNFDSAKSSFIKAIDFNPLKCNAYSSWAHLEAKLNAHENACIHFVKALQLNPDIENSGDTHLYCYAYSLFQIGRYREALSAIDKLLSVCPIHQTGLNTKAQILAILRRDDGSFTDEALKFFTERLLDNPSDMLARSELNLIYRDLGREKERRELIEETIAFEDPPAMALYDYAMLLERDGLIVKAITYLERAVAKEQNHAIAHSLARLYQKSGRYSEAIEYYRLALINVSNPIPILADISDCYHFMDAYESDIVILTRALLLGAQETSWWNNLFFALDKLNISRDEYFYFLSRQILGCIDLPEEEIQIELNAITQRSSIGDLSEPEQAEADKNQAQQDTLKQVTEAQNPQWQALYDQKLEEIGFGLDYHSPKQEEEPYPSFDAPDEEWVAWLQRTTDFENLEAEIQAGLYATTELSRQEREEKLRPPRTMTDYERGVVICTELIKVRSGLNDTLILSDRAKEDNYVQFTETICEVSSRAYASELPTLTKAQSEALQSLCFEQPDFSQGTPNYSMNWEVMSIKSVVNIVQQAFKIIGSPDDFELVVEN